MQNLQKNNLPLNVALFEVEELEERLENKWACGWVASGTVTPGPEGRSDVSVSYQCNWD